MMHLTWQPLVPWWLSLPLVIVIAGITIYYARRCLDQHRRWRYVITAMRLVAVAAVMLALLGPMRVDHQPAALADKPQLIVLVDASASMDTADIEGDTRLSFAINRWLKSRAITDAADSYIVRFTAFGKNATAFTSDQAETVHAQVDRQATDLSNALTTAGAMFTGSHPHNAILLLSDGHDTADVSRVGSSDIPVFAVPIGSVNAPADIDVQVAALHSQLYVNEIGQVRISVLQRGNAERSVRVTVDVNGRSEEHVLTFDGDMASIDMPVRFTDVGSHEVAVTAAPRSAEVVTANNTARTYIDVTNARPEVLILEADPTWDSRFIAQSLSRDDRLAVTQFTQIGATRQQVTRTRSREDLPLPPANVDEWTAYDVVVLGGSLDRILTVDTAAHLIEAVRQRGTCVLFMRLPDTTQGAFGSLLASLAPLSIQPDADAASVNWPADARNAVTKATLQDAGLDDWPTNLPTLQAQSASPTDDADVLVAASDGRPLVAARQVGDGRVLTLNASGLWTWAMQSPDDARGHLLVDALAQQLVHRALGDAAAGSAWSLRVEPARQRVGDNVVVQLRSRIETLDPARTEVTAVAPDGRQTVLTWPAESVNEREQTWLYELTSPGIYTFRATSTSRANTEARTWRVWAYDDNEELLDPRARPDVLRHIAETSGGAVLDPADADALADVLRSRAVDRHASNSEVVPLWTDSAALVFVLILLGLEWITRKQLGLT